jgi:hypothetical protein
MITPQIKAVSHNFRNVTLPSTYLDTAGGLSQPDILQKSKNAADPTIFKGG